MNNTFPFSFVQSVADRFKPPQWVVDETQKRLVLFLNHVLMQEKEAQDRLKRKKGSILHIRWGVFGLDLLITPAGLLDCAQPDAKSDLLVELTENSPISLLQSVAGGKSPALKIEGDVQLAAELGWLFENLRWDYEEDLSRILGDVPAHTLANAARRIAAGLKQFAASAPVGPFASSPVPADPKAAS